LHPEDYKVKGDYKAKGEVSTGVTGVMATKVD